jgi:hypothetical protein
MARDYENVVHGDFYGADYYRYPDSNDESAIYYDDSEDKRTMSGLLVTSFGPRRSLEVGCATGLMVKAMRAYGVEADGFDFSRWCIDNASTQVREWVRWDDVLKLAQRRNGRTTSCSRSTCSSTCRPSRCRWPWRTSPRPRRRGHRLLRDSGVRPERVRPRDLQAGTRLVEARRGARDSLRRPAARRQGTPAPRPPHARDHRVVGAGVRERRAAAPRSASSGCCTSATTPSCSSRGARSSCS